MAVVRKSVLVDAVSREQFGRGVNLLKADFAGGVTTQTLGFGGTAVPVST